jgi:hypothetical protein
MKRESMIWMIVFAIGVVLIGIRAMSGGGFGRAYIRPVEHTVVEVQRTNEAGQTQTQWLPADSTDLNAPGVTRTASAPISWTRQQQAARAEFIAGDPSVSVSLSRTIGLWIAAFLTLCIFSFLYGDNPFYKLAESIFIGVSAAYWMVVQFWSVIVPNLLGNLVPEMVKSWAMPGLETTHWHVIYIIPLVLAIMLLWRLMPAGGWISRWPLAFFIGVFAGLRMVQFIQADFMNQIRNGILPLIVRTEQGINWSTSLWNIVSVVGVLACLTYFFFSIEHKGAVGKVARLGTWILMITFGAMFGYTVMGRIALLTGRLEFLFIDWLRLIDPLAAMVC